jgi:osmotically-inducible protein OsmY
VTEPAPYLIQHIRDALARDPDLNEFHLDVSVAADKVFVTGAVATEERREAITRLVREVAPEHEVVNEASVDHYTEPPGEERLQ